MLVACYWLSISSGQSRSPSCCAAKARRSVGGAPGNGARPSDHSNATGVADASYRVTPRGGNWSSCYVKCAASAPCGQCVTPLKVCGQESGKRWQAADSAPSATEVATIQRISPGWNHIERHHGTQTAIRGSRSRTTGVLAGHRARRFIRSRRGLGPSPRYPAARRLRRHPVHRDELADVLGHAGLRPGQAGRLR